jgi:hypothetical protein
MDKTTPKNKKRSIELATQCSEEAIRFNISEWQDEYNELEMDIFNKQDKLKYIQEKIDIWKEALEIKKWISLN